MGDWQNTIRTSCLKHVGPTNKSIPIKSPLNSDCKIRNVYSLTASEALAQGCAITFLGGPHCHNDLAIEPDGYKYSILTNASAFNMLTFFSYMTLGVTRGPDAI